MRATEFCGKSISRFSKNVFDTYLVGFLNALKSLIFYRQNVYLSDLIIIDKASQSDVSVLPGMLRGKQWLIVGDGKLVGPTEKEFDNDGMANLLPVEPQSLLVRSLRSRDSIFNLFSETFPSERVSSTRTPS